MERIFATIESNFGQAICGLVVFAFILASVG